MPTKAELEEKLREIGSLEEDPGCGCCAGSPFCRYCEALFDYEPLEDGTGRWSYVATHEDDCWFVANGFADKREWADR